MWGNQFVSYYLLFTENKPCILLMNAAYPANNTRHVSYATWAMFHIIWVIMRWNKARGRLLFLSPDLEG